MGTSFENGISVSFWAFLENNANIFYLKTGFPFFCDGLWWEPGLEKMSFWAFLENNANIFYLKTGFPFFWACDGNLWKIMPISSIWKRNFRCFFWACDGTAFENGISLFLGLWWEPLENNANIFYLKTGFPFFGFQMRFLWITMPRSSIWKRDFLFLGLWWEPLENNANIFWKRDFPFLACDGNLWKIINIFYLKTEFPCFFWACDGNLIWKRDFRVFLGFSGK